MAPLLAIYLLSLGRMVPEAPVQYERTPSRRGPQPIVLATLTGAAGLIATPAVRKAVRRLVRRDELQLDIDAPEDRAPADEGPSSPPSSAEDPLEDEEKFTLTPERLSAIASINSQLEKVGDQLAPVPVFTAAVGNGTSPLTVSFALSHLSPR